MTAVVVDTDVVSFIFKGDSRADAYREHLTGCLLVLSFMTIAELDRWALVRNWGSQRRTQMEHYLKKFVIYPFERQLCRQWAQVSDGVRLTGYTIPCADAWIAATAVSQQIPLVTNNVRHYLGVPGLDVLSESVG